MRTSRLSAFVLSSAAVAAIGSVAQAELIYAVDNTAARNLMSFDSATPGTVTTIAPLTGAIANHTVRAIDFRPNGGSLYALSTDSTGGTAQIYTVDLASGVMSAQGASFAMTGNTSLGVSMDFNPAADRLRIVTQDTVENNFRWNPVANAFVQADGDLTYDATSSANAGAGLSTAGVAYDRNDNDPLTGTTLYAYDFSNDDLATIGSLNGSPTSPNTGLAFSVGTNTGIVAGSTLGFDISGVTGTAYVTADIFLSSPANDNLYTVDLATGLHTLVGSTGTPLLDISVVVPEPASFGLLGLAATALLRRRR